MTSDADRVAPVALSRTAAMVEDGGVRAPSRTAPRVAGLAVAAALACAIALAGPGAAAGARAAANGPALVVDKGIIRRVTDRLLVLDALDGVRLSLRLAPATRVVLNGQAAQPADLVPGLAASATHPRGGAVRVVRAVGEPAVTQDRGVIASLSGSGLVLLRADGVAVTVTVGPATRIQRSGHPASLADLIPGLQAVVRHRGARPAIAIRAFGRVPAPGG